MALGNRAFLFVLVALLPVCGPTWRVARAGAPSHDVDRLIAALAGPNAVAEHEASRRLVALGDAAVPALERLAGSPGPLAPRLLAVERLGEIRTPAALDALLALLRAEQDLAVRGQLCMQLGHARERRAIPLIAAWLRGVRSLADVPGPKEKQPSTCFTRHVEALEMIGDESAIPFLEEIAPTVHRIAPGGFIQVFVSEGVRQAIANLRAKAAFWADVRKHPGLEEKIGPLLASFRPSTLARLRIYESEIVRRTEEGHRLLERLARGADPAVADGAKALIEAGW
jgi:hypothetical protein